jgi:hypothetical protein
MQPDDTDIHSSRVDAMEGELVALFTHGMEETTAARFIVVYDVIYSLCMRACETGSITPARRIQNALQRVAWRLEHDRSCAEAVDKLPRDVLKRRIDRAKDAASSYERYVARPAAIEAGLQSTRQIFDPVLARCGGVRTH